MNRFLRKSTELNFFNRVVWIAMLFVVAVGTQLHASTYDGPAELPRVYVQSALASTPSPGKIWTVSAAGNVQAAINNASCGDTILLQAGASFTTSLTLPAKSCDSLHWITIRSSASNALLPAPGSRLTPCYAGVASLPGRPALNCKSTQKVVATIQSPGRGGTAALFISDGANHYRIIGLELTRTTSGYVNALVAIHGVANHIVLDRLWIHGTTHDDTGHGVQLGGGTNIALIDSYVNDLHCTATTGGCTDSQAVCGGLGSNPMGPYQIVDNYLEASGENIMFGGGAATLSPADIEIRRNHLYKPLIWKQGTTGYISGNSSYPNIVKNLFELKNAQRVLVDGNIMEYSWGGFSQAGYAVLLTPGNQTIGTTNVCPMCQVTDVTIRNSTISHVGAGFQIANRLSDGGGAPLAGERYSIHDVTVDDINGTKYVGPGLFALVAMLNNNVPVLRDVEFNHVTGFAPNQMLAIGDLAGNPDIANFVLQNSILTTGLYPVWSTGGYTNCAISDKPLTVFSTCFTPYTFTHNALVGTPAVFGPILWPAGNYFPSSSQVEFTSYNGGSGGNYQLLSSSPYKNAGTDGKDLGANITAIRTATAGVY